jgi:hypothetical protein
LDGLVIFVLFKLQVDLDIHGRSVHFEVDAADPNSVRAQATTFCTQYGAQFGVTEDTLSTCIDNIQQALERPLAAYVAEPMEIEPLGEQQQQQQQEQEPQEEQVDVEVSATADDSANKNDEVFVSSFPVGAKNFEYRFVLGVAAATNAAKFCETFWSELEGAFVEVSASYVIGFILGSCNAIYRHHGHHHNYWLLLLLQRTAVCFGSVYC